MIVKFIVCNWGGQNIGSKFFLVIFNFYIVDFVEIEYDEEKFAICVLIILVISGGLYNCMDIIIIVIGVTYELKDDRIVINGFGCDHNIDKKY